MILPEVEPAAVGVDCDFDCENQMDVEVDSLAVSRSMSSQSQEQTETEPYPQECQQQQQQQPNALSMKKSTILSRLGTALHASSSSETETDETEPAGKRYSSRVHATYSNRNRNNSNHHHNHHRHPSLSSLTIQVPFPIDQEVSPSESQQTKRTQSLSSHNSTSPATNTTTATKTTATSFLAPIIPCRPQSQSCLTRIIRQVLGCGIVTGRFCIDRHSKHYEHVLLLVQERAEFSELCNRIDDALKPTNQQFTRYAARQQVVGLCAVALMVLAICLCIEGAASTTQKSLLYYTTMGFVACCLVLLFLQRCVSGIHVQRSWNEGMDDLERLFIQENRAPYKVFAKVALETTISQESLTGWGLACLCRPVPLAVRVHVKQYFHSPRHALLPASPTRRKGKHNQEEEEAEEKKEDV